MILQSDFHQRPPLYNGHFFGGGGGGGGAGSPFIDFRFNLTTTATSFCPQDGRCREVQLYVLAD